MNIHRFAAAGVALGLSLSGCSGADQAPAGGSPVTGTATAADGTPIAYRDYGGDGPALILLTGLGNSAVVYDDFAPRFTDTHRVVAITRRGFGDSGKPTIGYDNATRAADDLTVLDELSIDEAVFVGHSVAGSELAELGARHGERVIGLVFLDAAGQPLSPDQESAVDGCIRDTESWAPGRTVSDDPLDDLLTQQQAWYPFPLPPSTRAELDAVTDIDEDGTVHWKESGAARGALGSATTDLTEVAEPSLAIIAVSRDPAVHFPWMTADNVPQEDRARAAECAALSGDLAQAAVDAAAGNPLIQTQVWPDAHHYVFLQFPQRTEDAIEEWLANLPG
jgi:pimeloyl-ACP methyl ester carboxylesterase